MALEASFSPRPGLRRAESECTRRVQSAQQDDGGAEGRVQEVAEAGDGAAEGRGHHQRCLPNHPRLQANQLDERKRRHGSHGSSPIQPLCVHHVITIIFEEGRKATDAVLRGLMNITMQRR